MRGKHLSKLCSKEVVPKNKGDTGNKGILGRMNGRLVVNIYSPLSRDRLALCSLQVVLAETVIVRLRSPDQGSPFWLILEETHCLCVLRVYQ